VANELLSLFILILSARARAARVQRAWLLGTA
jgi:hypothetical protein